MDLPSFDWIADPTAWLGLATLIALEIVLGVDNLIFIAILADKLPPEYRNRARIIGLSLALFMRLALLASLSWLVSLTQPLIAPFGFELSGRDLILLAGGLFLLYKATTELHERLEGAHASRGGATVYAGFWAVVAQIVVIDAVFSLDSVITAVGMTDELAIMMIAVMVAIGVMMVASGPLTAFVVAHPTVVILCLGFLLMIGFSLVVEAFHMHMPKGYLYAAIGFSVLIEALNQLAQRNRRRLAGPGHDLRARAADTVLRLLGGRPGPVAVEDEVASLARRAGQRPIFQAAEREMIRGVFDLAERPVRSIMTPRRDVIWIDLDRPQAELRRILESRRTRYPVARGSLDNVIGVAQAKDLLRDLAEKGAIDFEGSVAHATVVHDEMSVLHLLERFRGSSLHFAIVVDEHGNVVGVVTPTDILEAIAGEMQEEGEKPPLTARQQDGSWLFDASIDLRQAGQMLGADLARGDQYSSLAGYLLLGLGRMPRQGEIIERDGLCFEIVAMGRRHIETVRVRQRKAEPTVEAPAAASPAE